MNRRAKKISCKSYDQILHERALALSDRVRDDDKRVQALAKRLEQRIKKLCLVQNNGNKMTFSVAVRLERIKKIARAVKPPALTPNNNET